MSRSCVIVGGGIAGLSAAFRLSNAGIRVTVLEADSALGGRTRNEVVNGCVVNTGAAFVTSFYDATLALLKELPVKTIEPAEQSGVVATPFGKLPLDLGSAQRIVQFPLITFAGKIRALSLFAQTWMRRPLHIGKPQTLARLDRGSTIESWGRRALGENAYHYLLRAGIEPFFYFGAEQASSALGKALIRHARRWHMLAIEDGIGSICNALSQRLEVRTGCKVSEIEERDTSIIVHHSGGTIEADHVILAIPAPSITRLRGDIPPEDREQIEAVRFVPNMLLYFGYERPITVQHPLVTPAGPERHAIARIRTISQWIPSYVPEGKELISIHTSSWRSAELVNEEPETAVNAIRRDAEVIFGRLADPDWIRLYARPHAVVLPQPGHYRRMRAFLRRPRKRLLYARRLADRLNHRRRRSHRYQRIGDDPQRVILWRDSQPCDDLRNCQQKRSHTQPRVNLSRVNSTTQGSPRRPETAAQNDHHKCAGPKVIARRQIHIGAKKHRRQPTRNPRQHDRGVTGNSHAHVPLQHAPSVAAALP